MDEESRSSKARRNADAQTFEITEESHCEEVLPEEEICQEASDPHEAPSDEDVPSAETSSTLVCGKSSTCTRSMHHGIRNILKSALSPGDQEGCIYVFKDVDRTHLCKIGRATVTKARVATLEGSCELQLELLHEVPEDFYKMTEVLIHAFWSDHCRSYICGLCRCKHTEWFETSQEVAKTAVDKWVDFMSRESPYNSPYRGLAVFWLLSLRVYRFASADFRDAG